MNDSRADGAEPCRAHNPDAAGSTPAPATVLRLKDYQAFVRREIARKARRRHKRSEKAAAMEARALERASLPWGKR